MRGFPPFHGGPVTTSRCSNRERLAGLHTLFTSLIEGLAKQRLGGELAEFPRACSPTISGDAAKGSTESVTSRAAFGSYVSCVMVVPSRKPPPPRWATPAEAADRLGVTPTTVRRWLSEERIAGVQVGGRCRVDPASLETFARPLTHDDAAA